ncbi:MAG: ZIP family metal transporter [Burkholderiales bacterium]|nr:ZIP family metal transporter [Burkholderiales bacterium]
MILTQILLATLAAGLLSVLAAALIAVPLLKGAVHQLVSLSAGLLLATALLHVLPEAIESGADLHLLCATLLAGLVGFFLLEKLDIMRHSHHYEGDGHGHAHGHDREEAGPGGLMILVGDSIHNFADGVMIAAAFATDPGLGWLTTFAIATHEIPQEIGDYILLLNAGYTRSRALLFNGLASLAAVLGGVVGYFALSAGQGLQPYVLILAAASFIYIALADLVPDLHRQSRRAKAGWLKQSMLMLTGIAIIAVLTSHFHLH